jgi:hypothetical protein
MNKESDIGNIEYKRFIKFNTSKRQDSLASQLKFRLKEGNGFCIYYIGLEDNGIIFSINEETFNESIENLKLMCQQVNAHIISVIKKYNDTSSYYEIKIGDIIPTNEYRILNICSSTTMDNKNQIDFVGIDNDNNILSNSEYSIYDIKKNSQTLLYIYNAYYIPSKIIKYILTFKPHIINFEYNFDQINVESIDISKILALLKLMNINYTFENNIINKINDIKDLLINPQISKNIINIFDVLFNGNILNDVYIYACISNTEIYDIDNIYVHHNKEFFKLDIIDIQHICQSSLTVPIDKLISLSTKHKIKNDYHLCSNIECKCNIKNTDLIDCDKIYNIEYNKEYNAYYKNNIIKVQFNETFITQDQLVGGVYDQKVTIKLSKNVYLDEKYLIIDLIDQYILISVY